SRPCNEKLKRGLNPMSATYRAARPSLISISVTHSSVLHSTPRALSSRAGRTRVGGARVGEGGAPRSMQRGLARPHGGEEALHGSRPMPPVATGDRPGDHGGAGDGEVGAESRRRDVLANATAAPLTFDL